MPYRKDKYRDMEKLRHTRGQYNQKYYSETAKYKRRSWCEEEISLLFDERLSDRQLSILLKRSMKAITVKRSKIRKVMGLQCTEDG